jgi:hypothetical protein
MSENIFQADQSVNSEVEVQQPVVPQELSEIVGEGKKYATVEQALKSVPHAQKHIQTLEEELNVVKQELEKRKTAEALVEEFKNQGFPKSETTPQVEGLSVDSVAEIVKSQLSQLEIERKAKENTTQVVGAFKAKFGDKAEEMFIKVAQESGIPVAALNQLSASSPSAVYKLAGIDAPTKAVTKPTSSVNTESLQLNQSHQELSAKVRQGATTKDVTTAWRIAGEKVKQKLSI